MGVALKTSEDLEVLREGGKHLKEVLEDVSRAVKPGVSTSELNDLALSLIREKGDEPAFLGYHPSFADRPYPAAICISVNDEVVHGIPNENSRVLKEGDVVGLDCGLIHNGRVVDAARTVAVGKVPDNILALLKATQEGLDAGIQQARLGNRVGDIGHAIETVADRYGFGVVYELGGHGVGYAVHEEPHIANFGDPGTGPKLLENLVLAIEPMFNEGTPDVVLAEDGYTYKTADGKYSAHFEDTIVVTANGPEILTR